MADPIDLDKLSVSLAASMVSAHRYLIAANQELEELYQSTETLGQLPLPRFSLGAVTFEVPYVVEQVNSTPPAPPPEIRLTKDVAVATTELSSLKRGASDIAAQQLDTLLADYAVVKKSLSEVVAQSSDGRATPASLPKLTPAVQLSDTALQELTTGASKAAVGRLSQLAADYEAARTALVRMREVVSAGATPRLAVRVDAESIAKAQGNVHKMVLKFSADDRAPIKVEGHST